jgi:steroid delta-isomerase-like uncharacterized protein
MRAFCMAVYDLWLKVFLLPPGDTDVTGDVRNSAAGRQATTNLNSQEKTMNALEVTQRSFDAWNRHDADAILALYAQGGTYSAPRAGQALTGQAIANYVKALSTAYPDFSIETISSGDTGGGLVATQWVFHGTHTGPYFDGSPPSGRTLTLPGASFTQVEGDKIRYERVYTDRQTVTEQLGFTPKKT